MPMVEIKDLHKSFETGGEVTRVLQGLDLVAQEGEAVMVMGPSGCGKTTLLNLLGGIDSPNEGSIVVAGQDVTRMGPRELGLYRRGRVGFIFQFYNLLPTLTARENVELGIELVLRDERAVRERAAKYLDLVGLSDRAGLFPQELSAGQQQRVAIARALAKEPRLVLADEPTGNIDEERARSVMELMERLRGELGTTFVIVSHNASLREYVDRTLVLRMGRLEETAGA
jgi:putative ABC transport system ATP-binding protein